jgi:hypothetical protein
MDSSDWRKRNPEKQKSLTAKWQRENSDRRAATNAKWEQRNPGRRAKLAAAWRARNIDRARKIGRVANAKRRATVSGRLNVRVGNAVRASLNGSKGWRPTFDLLPYTIEELKTHIERQFTQGMTWERFMAGEIHIDHIRPLAIFDFQSTDSSSFLQAWAITNLRPLWAQENLKKGAKAMFLI